MNSESLSWLSFLLIVFVAFLNVTQISSDYPGVIELVGYGSRRPRTNLGNRSENGTTMSKMQSDIETVKLNIEKYNKLLTVDTKNLPESQKDMLKRIVERVARLKESFNLNDDPAKQLNETQQRRRLNDNGIEDEKLEFFSTTILPTMYFDTETETDATPIVDDTTFLQLQTTESDDSSDDSLPDSGKLQKFPITTEFVTSAGDYTANHDAYFKEYTTASDDYDTDDQSSSEDTMASSATEDQIVARSNNNLATISAAVGSSSSTSGSNIHRTLVTKSKTRQNSTKRPPLSTKSSLASSPSSSASTSTTKRVSSHGQRPLSSSSSSFSSSSSPSLKSTTVTSSSPSLHSGSNLKQKIVSATMTTTQPQHYHQQQLLKQKQHQLLQLQQQQQQQEQQLQQKQQQQDERESYLKLHQKKPSKSQQQQNYHDSLDAATSPMTVEQKIVTIPTMPSEQILREQQHIQQRTPLISGSGSISGSSSSINSNSDILYDANVNTSAIIDSLSNAREEFYNQKLTIKDKKPSATAKPTKYHFYPHNQHIYILPECAVQQVCNAVYVRLNYTQPLCACPSRYRDPCSASLNEDDQHTTKLVGDVKKKAITLAKTCEARTEMRECRAPKDWSLLALQNTRTGKSHYLVICRCPDNFKMEGPMAHDQPTYASVPGIRVFGMMCVKPGISLRKPSAQPPKRYQLQKPYYIPNSQNKYANKDYNRPSSFTSSSSSIVNGNGGYQQDNFQIQHQANYQYLNRNDNPHFGQQNIGDYPESISIHNFGGDGGIYGRNNERKGEKPISATPEDDQHRIVKSTSTMSPEDTRATISGGSDANSASNNNNIGDLIDSEVKREKRSIVSEYNHDSRLPEFPWKRVMEFEESIIWE